MIVDTTAAYAYILPSVQSAYMDYARHVDTGLAGEAWCRQGRERDCNEKTINLVGKSKYAAAVVTVGNEDGRGTEMTGSLTPDLTL